MKYTLMKPCRQCPFLKGSGFKLPALRGHASGEFPCHRTCVVDEESESGDFVPTEKSVHCAGALIFHVKRGTSTQMMRIAHRLNLFDPSKLDMKAKVQ